MCRRVDLNWDIDALLNFLDEVLFAKHLDISVNHMIVLGRESLVCGDEISDCFGARVHFLNAFLNPFDFKIEAVFSNEVGLVFKLVFEVN